MDTASQNRQHTQEGMASSVADLESAVRVGHSAITGVNSKSLSCEVCVQVTELRK